MDKKRVEFWVTPEGKVHYRLNDEKGEREFNAASKEIIDMIMDVLCKLFPQALIALKDIYSKHENNIVAYRFLIAERFIRCNFGMRDYMRNDIDHGMFSFEEVVCPLRGRCQHEGVICKPQISTKLDKGELMSAILYSEGKYAEEIGEILGKTGKTIMNKLLKVRDKLGLSSTREIPKVMHSFCVDNIKSLLDYHGQNNN